MAGVLGVFGGVDCLADGLAPIPHSPVPSTRYDLKLTGPGGGTIFIGPQTLLPADKVRHVGEAVAMVVAETLRKLSTRRGRSRSNMRSCPGSPARRALCRPVLQRSGTKCRTTSSSIQYSATRRRLTGHSPASTMSSQWIYILVLAG